MGCEIVVAESLEHQNLEQPVVGYRLSLEHNQYNPVDVLFAQFGTKGHQDSQYKETDL